MVRFHKLFGLCVEVGDEGAARDAVHGFAGARAAEIDGFDRPALDEVDPVLVARAEPAGEPADVEGFHPGRKVMLEIKLRLLGRCWGGLSHCGPPVAGVEYGDELEIPVETVFRRAAW